MRLDGPVALALLHGGHVAGLLVLVGTLGAWGGPPGPARAGRPPGRAGQAGTMDGARRWIALGAGMVALALGVAWFLAVTASLNGADSLGATWAMIPTMLAVLRFARLLAWRLAGLAVATALLALPGPRGPWRALMAGVLGVLALAVEPWLGHAGAAGGWAGLILPGAELVHLGAAAIWLGALPLLIARLRRGDPAALIPLLRRFAATGQIAVAAIAASGVVQGAFLLGGWARLSGTFYGRALLLKTALFAAALALAAVNRFVLTPRVAAAPARQRLLRAVAIEAGLGLAIVLAAGFLAGLPPGVDQGAVAARIWPWATAGAVVFVFGLVALVLARLPGPAALSQGSEP